MKFPQNVESNRKLIRSGHYWFMIIYDRMKNPIHWNSNDTHTHTHSHTRIHHTHTPKLNAFCSATHLIVDISIICHTHFVCIFYGIPLFYSTDTCFFVHTLTLYLSRSPSLFPYLPTTFFLHLFYCHHHRRRSFVRACVRPSVRPFALVFIVSINKITANIHFGFSSIGCGHFNTFVVMTWWILSLFIYFSLSFFSVMDQMIYSEKYPDVFPTTQW